MEALRGARTAPVGPYLLLASLTMLRGADKGLRGSLIYGTPAPLPPWLRPALSAYRDGVFVSALPSKSAERLWILHSDVCKGLDLTKVWIKDKKINSEFGSASSKTRLLAA